jgi:hypothetical protein
MIGIGKNHIALVTIGTLASILLVNAIAIGTDGHIALARHYENTQVFKKGHINIQTDTNQGQACETAGASSSISDSCTTSSLGGVIQSTQGAVPPSHSACTPLSTTTLPPPLTPTLLTITASPGIILSNGANQATVSGRLIDIVTGAGICGATIIISTPGPAIASNGQSLIDVVTATNGLFSTTFMGAGAAGDAPLNAAFAGGGIYGPSSASKLLIVAPSGVRN